MTNDRPDIEKIKPMVFSMHDDLLDNSNNYWKVGAHIGRAWSIGMDFERKEMTK